MKLEQQQQAEYLYLKTDLSKAEIARFLGVSRRSLTQWAGDNEWDRIKTSNQHMPCLIAENCYHIVAKLQENILSELRVMRPVTPDEVNMINKMSIAINRFRKRNTLNEDLEMMSYFIDYVNSETPGIAEAIQPAINGFIKSRARVAPWQFKPKKMNDQGFIPATGPTPSSPLEVYPDPSSGRAGERSEDQLDLEDFMDWAPTPTDPTPTPSLSSMESTEGEGVPGATPSPLDVYPDPSSGRAGERSYDEFLEQQDEKKAYRKQLLAEVEELIKNKQQAQAAKNKKTPHLNRAQRRELERQAKASNKQYPKAA